MFLLVGIVGAMLSESLLNILGGVLQINNLKEVSYLVYLVILVVLLAVADVAARVLSYNFV